MMSRYGGGNRRGTVWLANDIYLRRVGEKITLKEVLDNTEKEVIYTKEGQLMGFLCTDTRDIPAYHPICILLQIERCNFPFLFTKIKCGIPVRS